MPFLQHDITKSDDLLEVVLIIAYVFQIVWHVLIHFEEFIIVLSFYKQHAFLQNSK